jgi:NADPH-dependent 2,4-dienoyl-CoA reductase/sulfur reductase-like enzyme
MKAVAALSLAACVGGFSLAPAHTGSTLQRASLRPSALAPVAPGRLGSSRRALPVLAGSKAAATIDYSPPDAISPEAPLKVILAGGGVGGLVAAKYLKQSGFDVTVSGPLTAAPPLPLCQARRRQR